MDSVKQELLYDPRNPELRKDPYPFYKRLQETDPVYLTPFGYWVVSGYEETAALLRDPRLTSEFHRDAKWAEHRGGWESPVVSDTRKWMLMLDGSAHRRIRGLVNPVFSARAILRMRPRIVEILHKILDDMGSGKDIDLISALALPVPVTVICGLVGLPVEDRDQCRQWTEAIGHVVDPALSEQTQQAMNTALVEFRAYIAEHLALRRKDPQDDILSRLLAAEVDGEKLSDDEIIANVLLLFNAGHETTVNLIGNGMLALLRHPDQLRALRENPGLLDEGIDEFVRFDAPVQLVARIATDDIDVGGKTIPAGAKLMLLLGAANRDARRYEEADRLRLDRPDIKPLAFGGGPHYCIGAMLGRMEGQLVFSELVNRYSDISLTGEDLVWRPHVNFRGLSELRLDLLP
ncbi:cytochrome P450 [Streptomyces sp. SP18CS02]|uniref:cytochrome P450 n=1 Tax=Streptomyces sp. SP18CS02 TaxID=3002531 RepID=UPI002E79958E|nr:cytochrome P450 [Streptomyces sp. SP18CS02]MEE1753799.1 cytochrome P450 [Streptomyces sp. SP18CS02]